MLPDLRVLLLATVTTFLLATGAGLYASVRLLPEPLTAAHPDRDTPISRVALSWQDMSRAPLREITPAVLHEPADVPQAKEIIAPPVKDSATPQPKAEDRPFASPPAQNVSVPSPAPGESIAVKSERGPATTGAITEPQPATTAPQSGKPKFAARPDPAEAVMDADPPAATQPVPEVLTPELPKVKKAKPEPRKIRRARVVRQDQQITGTGASEPASNFFTDFGSRQNQ